MNNSLVHLRCYDTWKYFQHHGFDLRILITLSVLTAILIVTANSRLLTKLLRKKKKVRADKLFVILCFSDIGIGAFSIPLQSVLLFTPNLKIVCSLHKLITFSNSFPFSFSWVMLVIIFTDRCFVITRCRLYNKYITMKVLYIIIAIELALSITSITLIALIRELKLHPTKFDLFHIFQTTAQMFFISVGACFHGYILYFVGKNSKDFRQSARYRNRNYTKKLTRTIMYIYLCLVFFTVPHTVYSFLIFFIKPKGYLVIRNISFGDTLLNYSNSYVNALLYLCNMRRNTRGNKINPDTVSRFTVTSKV